MKQTLTFPLFCNLLGSKYSQDALRGLWGYLEWFQENSGEELYDPLEVLANQGGWSEYPTAAKAVEVILGERMTSSAALKLLDTRTEVIEMSGEWVLVRGFST